MNALTQRGKNSSVTATPSLEGRFRRRVWRKNSFILFYSESLLQLRWRIRTRYHSSCPNTCVAPLWPYRDFTRDLLLSHLDSRWKKSMFLPIYPSKCTPCLHSATLLSIYFAATYSQTFCSAQFEDFKSTHRRRTGLPNSESAVVPYAI